MRRETTMRMPMQRKPGRNEWPVFLLAAQRMAGPQAEAPACKMCDPAPLRLVRRVGAERNGDVAIGVRPAQLGRTHVEELSACRTEPELFSHVLENIAFLNSGD